MDLEIGETTRAIECPFCAVHDKEPGSFGVTRTVEGILYQCFRAKCGVKGFISSSITSLYGKIKDVKKDKTHMFTWDVSSLDAKRYRALIMNYNLTADEIETNNIKWSHERQRMLIPLLDKWGRQWGWEAKVVKGAADRNIYKGSKSLKYQEATRSVGLHYPEDTYDDEGATTRTNTDCIVLVEDVFSAIRVQRHVSCVALLGTNINLEQVIDIASNYDKIIVALDPDATDKAIKMETKYTYYFDKFKVKQLSKDPKNMNEEELEKEFTELF